jgi:hypothetical protein
MDVSNVPNEINGAKDNILELSLEAGNSVGTTPICATNTPENINNTFAEKGKMHMVIIIIMIALFSFIVMYCLFMQLWWVLGVLAIPLLRKAMLKIIDRYV